MRPVMSGLQLLRNWFGVGGRGISGVQYAHRQEAIPDKNV